MSPTPYDILASIQLRDAEGDPVLSMPSGYLYYVWALYGAMLESRAEWPPYAADLVNVGRGRG